jgi:outer membrane murein-binding lipoprotein Lpp
MRVVVIGRIMLVSGAVLLMAATTSGCSAVGPPKQNIGEMIANARTASDYDAIADYYDKEAADAKAKYEDHEASVVRYENSTKWRTWAWHCDRLAQDFKAAQGEAQALAAEHRRVAAEMKSGETSTVSGPSPQLAKQSM